MQRMPWSNKSAPIKKVVQTWDPLELRELVSTIVYRKYLAFSTFAQSVLGLV